MKSGQQRKGKFELFSKGRVFGYYINLDERGEFHADVRKESNGKTVFEIHEPTYDDEGFQNSTIFDDGFMKHKTDLTGLAKHLASFGILKAGDTLEMMN